MLEISIKIEDISKLIPYLASKFSRDHFKKIQINLFVGVYVFSKTLIED
jgi:hypothetical protein